MQQGDNSQSGLLIKHVDQARDADKANSTVADTTTSDIKTDPDEVTQPFIDPQLAAVADEVMRECRAALMTKFRFMDVALWHMPYEPDPSAPLLSTDGTTLSYNPMLAVLRYYADPHEGVRDYLHSILHCLFRQPFDEKHPQANAWSLTCDVMVESLAMDMCGERYRCALDVERVSALEQLRKQCGSLAPEKLYRLFSSAATMVELQECNRLVELFERDSHHCWACMREQKQHDEHTTQDSSAEHQESEDSLSNSSETQDESDSGKTDGTQERSSDVENPDTPEVNPSENPNSSEDSNSPSTSLDTQESENKQDAATMQPTSAQSEDNQQDASDQTDNKQAWESIAKQVELELASRSLSWDENAGSLAVVLAVANRQTCNYADFLRKFSVLTEDLKVNDDEFDYIFYTYGLDRYGNMPLVEPLEYQDCNRVREFVIAIDTSGSCSGEIVRTFIARTYDILKESESFSSIVNVHIVQCDARIQSDTKISCLRELDDYLETYTLRGFGGTDFRPVFEYVDRLIDEGEFSNLQGLIYFTDGLGTFPTRKPTYDTAFVFVNDEMASPHVPPWAMKAVLDEASVNQI